MAALISRPAPTVVLRELLAEKRRDGCDFDVAWSWSLERLFSPAPTGEARVWREALGATRAAWEAAYARAEGPGAAALAILGDGRKPTEGVLPIGALPDGLCEQCGEPMNTGAGRRYCSARCRVAAHRERERSAA